MAQRMVAMSLPKNLVLRVILSCQTPSKFKKKFYSCLLGCDMVSDHGQVRGNYDGVRGNLDAATLGKVLNYFSEILIG